MIRHMYKRVFSILLLTVMLVSLTGCNEEKNDNSSNDAADVKNGTEETAENGSKNESDNQDEEPAGYERIFDKYIQGERAVDLNGYEFIVADFHSSRWDPEEISSPLDELVVSIVEDVEKTFNCTITFKNVSPDQIFNEAQTSVMSGDKYADLIGTTMWAYGNLLGANLLADLNKVETLNLDNEYWNQNIREISSFGKSTYSFGAPFGTHMDNYYVVYYNVRIWEELNLPDPYTLVENGQWTWDKFIEYAKAATRDMDGDGLISSENDRWGVMGPSGDTMTAAFYGLGGRYYKNVDDGTGNIVVRLAATDSVIADKIDTIYKFYQNDNILYKNENVGAVELFVLGKSLFLCMTNALRTDMKEMEDEWGILPMPKWDEKQAGYICAPDHNAPVFCMTNSNTNTFEAGIIIEALGKRYQAFDELAIDDRDMTYWRLEETREIEEKYIIGYGAYDIIDLIKNANSQFNTPASIMFAGCYNNTYSDIVSTMKSFEDQINIMLDEFFVNLSK